MKIEELFVPYDIAFNLRNKGFEYECLAYYHDVNYELIIGVCENIQFYKSVAAPLYQQVIDWFRDKHGLELIIGSDILGYNINIFNRPAYRVERIEPINITRTYREAQDLIIEKAIELI